MSTTSVLPVPWLSADVEPGLIELAEKRMLAPARQRGYELRLVGATVLPERQIIARSPSGAWLFVDHVEDPTVAEYGGKIPIPEAEHAKLTELARAHVSPDLVWLGHQLPDTWREGDAIPQLVPASAHLREKDERLIRRLDAATKLFLKGAGAAVTAAVAPLALVGAATGLDPIILGGVRHPEWPIVEWCLLAQWQWK